MELWSRKINAILSRYGWWEICSPRKACIEQSLSGEEGLFHSKVLSKCFWHIGTEPFYQEKRLVHQPQCITTLKNIGGWRNGMRSEINPMTYSSFQMCAKRTSLFCISGAESVSRSIICVSNLVLIFLSWDNVITPFMIIIIFLSLVIC